MAGKGDRFASEVRSREDVPEALQDIFTEILGKGSPIRKAVYAPPMDLLAAADKKYFGGYLLVVSDELLTVGIEQEEILPQLVEIPIGEIICIESGSVLLYSWFQVFFGKEECKEIKVLYNTVGEELFREIIFLLRRKLDISADPVSGAAVESELPLKFRNELRYWLFTGETIIDCAFQPEITEPYLWFLNKPVAPPLLGAVTTRQILMITEIEPVLRTSFGRYSEIYIYCPFSRFESGEVRAIGARPGLEHFTLMLTNDRAWHSTGHVIEAENADKFRALCALMYRH